MGVQGACSYHGGIKEDPFRYVVVLVSVILGFASFAFVADIEVISTRATRYMRAGKIFCPKCDSVMRLRKGRHGKFYGCSQYPKCMGTRDADSVPDQVG